jgi:hypothetical protein
MALTNNDFKLYGSAVMPEDDVLTDIGGAIDLTTQISFTPLGGEFSLEVLSSNAGDVMDLTLTGRAPNGTILTKTVTVAGLTVVDITGTFKRLLKAVLTSAPTGNVIIRKDGAAGDIMTFDAGSNVTTIRRPFQYIGADLASGADRTFYEKIFYRNSNASDALIGAKIKLAVNPSGRVKFALDAALGASTKNGAGNNRAVAPAALVFNTTEKAVPTGDLLQNNDIGIWMKIDLPKGSAASDDTIQFDITGNGN